MGNVIHIVLPDIYTANSIRASKAWKYLAQTNAAKWMSTWQTSNSVFDLKMDRNQCHLEKQGQNQRLQNLERAHADVNFDQTSCMHCGFQGRRGKSERRSVWIQVKNWHPRRLLYVEQDHTVLQKISQTILHCHGRSIGGFWLVLSNIGLWSIQDGHRR